MKRKLNSKEKYLYKQVARILWKEWDPLGVHNEENEWDDEYDNYVPHIFSLLNQNQDEYKISTHLTQICRTSMGMGKQVKLGMSMIFE